MIKYPTPIGNTGGLLGSTRGHMGLAENPLGSTRVAQALKLDVFEFTVTTTGASETFALPLHSGGTYSFSADWGDGINDDITAWDDAAVTHTYANADTYHVKITGTLDGWKFANAGDMLKIYNIFSWGSLKLGSGHSHFYGCANLTVTAIDILDTTGKDNFKNTFRDCTSLTLVPNMNLWDMSSVVDIDRMFFSASVFDQDIGNWNVSSVTTAVSMFNNATLSIANYNALLVGWEAQSVQGNVVFSGGDSKYDAGSPATARAALISDHTWTITDGGPA